eukprot:6190403-Pleurochrysis_carterae.AAC.2
MMIRKPCGKDAAALGCRNLNMFTIRQRAHRSRHSGRAHSQSTALAFKRPFKLLLLTATDAAAAKSMPCPTLPEANAVTGTGGFGETASYCTGKDHLWRCCNCEGTCPHETQIDPPFLPLQSGSSTNGAAMCWPAAAVLGGR